MPETKLWLNSAGQIIRNAAGEIQTCDDCPCDTGTGTGVTPDPIPGTACTGLFCYSQDPSETLYVTLDLNGCTADPDLASLDGISVPVTLVGTTWQGIVSGSPVELCNLLVSVFCDGSMTWVATWLKCTLGGVPTTCLDPSGIIAKKSFTFAANTFPGTCEGDLIMRWTGEFTFFNTNDCTFLGGITTTICSGTEITMTR